MTDLLRIAPGLALDADYVGGGTFALLAKIAAEPKTVDVPAVSESDVKVLRNTLGDLAAQAAEIGKFADYIREAGQPLAAALDRVAEDRGRARVDARGPSAPARPVALPPRPPKAAAPTYSNGDGPTLNRKAERMVLAVLAQYPDGRTKRQTAILAGYALNGGGYNGALSKLRTVGLIEGSDPLRITDAGLAAIDGQYEPLPTGAALLDHWLGTMKRRAEREVLQVVYDAWPDSISKEEVAERAGYEASGGGFSGAVSKLKTLELVSVSGGELRVADALRE